MKAQSIFGQTLAEHLSSVEEGEDVFIIGAAKACGRIPGTAMLAAVVHMVYTSPTIGCRRISEKADIAEWELDEFHSGESQAYREACDLHDQQRHELSKAVVSEDHQGNEQVLGDSRKVSSDRILRSLRRMICDAPALIERF